MTIKTYKDILSPEIGIYWHGNIYYPPETITENQKKAISNINCDRFIFSAEPNDDSIYSNCYKELYKLIFSNKERKHYQIYIDYEAKAPNRVRTYKGLLPKNQTKKIKVIEEEVSLGTITIIGGIISLSPNDFSDSQMLLNDNRYSFIISSNNDYFNVDFLIKMLKVYRKKGAQTSIDYIKLIIDFCGKKDIIYSIYNNKQGTVAINMFKTQATYL